MWKQCCKAAIESILPPFTAYSNYLELFGIIWNYLELFGIICNAQEFRIPSLRQMSTNRSILYFYKKKSNLGCHPLSLYRRFI
jgi:hypothetical protein